MRPASSASGTEPAIYPFLKPHFSPQELAAAATPDQRNELHATLAGLPPTGQGRRLADRAWIRTALMLDNELAVCPARAEVRARSVSAGDRRRQPVPDRPVAGVVPRGSRSTRGIRRWGGVLTKYLLPVVTELERQVESECVGVGGLWLAAAAADRRREEGADGLAARLLARSVSDPPGRRSCGCRSSTCRAAEATALANYFAAVDNAEYPVCLFRAAATVAAGGAGGGVCEAGASGPASQRPAGAGVGRQRPTRRRTCSGWTMR